MNPAQITSALRVEHLMAALDQKIVELAQQYAELATLRAEVRGVVRQWLETVQESWTAEEMTATVYRVGAPVTIQAALRREPYVPAPQLALCSDCGHPLNKHVPTIGCIAVGLVNCLCNKTEGGH